MPAPSTMFEKIWSRHVVVDRPDGYTLLFIDRHLLHDGSLPAFERLKRAGLKVRRPDRSFGTPDHYMPTGTRNLADIADARQRHIVSVMRKNADAAGITIFDIGDKRQGIVHVIGPEQGITLPGITLVCGDSHTSTHGALGALAFGIGSSEVTHVMATQTLWQRKPKAMRIEVDGTLGTGVTGKDVILAIIATMGAGGATGHVIEYCGSAIRSLSIEGRLTLCNMSIEGGGRAGLVAPDDKTFAYLAGRPYAPKGADWDQALETWKLLPTDGGAHFDKSLTLNATEIAPMVTWGTSPEDAVAVGGRVPDPAAIDDATRRATVARALAYQGLTPGMAISDIAVDRVFIGSCTNSRIEDLRLAAEVVRGRKAVVPSWVVPGSGLVKEQAEAEGLDRVFEAAGFEWRHAGCSMCVGMNGETGRPQERIASTSNRNFVGRQGRGVRTHLVSPASAAAASVTGRFTDVRRLLAP
ncbi:MAG TPA: 3-isopropylmalate dehydratase large subunit [Hyphomicrobiaceae bacterium]|nr:3-isopropylmalate dehydratase large subunit [Hyphomicrobiaceae bacterium]